MTPLVITGIIAIAAAALIVWDETRKGGPKR